MTDKTDGATRRDFWKVAAVAAPAAAAVSVAPKAAEAAPQPSEGMQDTAHTRAYFDSARF